MDVKPIVKQEKPATYTELGVIKVGLGLFIDNGGTLSIGYEVTATAGTGGSITPAGTTHVQAGGEITLYITPNEDYVIDTVTINGVQEAEPANEYTFADLSENKTIVVTFKHVLYIIKNGELKNGFTLSYYQKRSGSATGTIDHYINDNVLYLKASGNTGTTGTNMSNAATEQLVDYSLYNSIKCEVVSLVGNRGAIMSIKYVSDPPNPFTNITSTGIFSIDISNITSGLYLTSIMAADIFSSPETIVGFKNWWFE